LLTLPRGAQALGNLDVHGKNVSMVRLPGGTTSITPVHDVVPQTHRDSDGKMALAINRKYVQATITVDDLVAEAESWGLRMPDFRTTLRTSRETSGMDARPSPAANSRTGP